MNKAPFDYFSTRETEYKLAQGGYVRFTKEELQCVRPHYEDTVVTLKNGRSYLLEGRKYGV